MNRFPIKWIFKVTHNKPSSATDSQEATAQVSFYKTPFCNRAVFIQSIVARKKGRVSEKSDYKKKRTSLVMKRVKKKKSWIFSRKVAITLIVIRRIFCDGGFGRRGPREGEMLDRDKDDDDTRRLGMQARHGLSECTVHRPCESIICPLDFDWYFHFFLLLLSLFILVPLRVRLSSLFIK